MSPSTENATPWIVAIAITPKPPYYEWSKREPTIVDATVLLIRTHKYGDFERSMAEVEERLAAAYEEIFENYIDAAVFEAEEELPNPDLPDLSFESFSKWFDWRIVLDVHRESVVETDDIPPVSSLSE